MILQGSKTAFYSGPYAHLMVKNHLLNKERIDDNKWEAYVYYKDMMTVKLSEGTSVLYQVCVVQNGKMSVYVLDSSY